MKIAALLIGFFYLLLVPSEAFAHGDPSLLYSLAGGIVLHPLLGYLLFQYLKPKGPKRVISWVVYLMSVVAAWAAFIHGRGPVTLGFHIFFNGAPAITFILLFLLFGKERTDT